jgi:transmembrane sensor
MTVTDTPTQHTGALQREAQAWLLRLTSGQATTHDGEAFRRWCALSPQHRQAFAQARRLWGALGPAALAVQTPPPAAAVRRSAGIGARSLSRRAFLGGAVAASAAYVVARSPFGLWPNWSSWDADYRTGTGEQRQLEVAAGVTVQMNTQTAIKLRSMHDGTIGMELVSGEAQIQTGQNLSRPFTVMAGGGRVLADASTQCNIRCTGPEAQLICINGRTELRYGGQRAVVRPDQLVSYGDERIAQAAAVNPETAIAWRRRVLIFDNQPLSEVVAEINRYRPGKIILMDETLAARKVQARFTLAQLADVAALIRDAYGANATSLPGGVVLLS